MAKPKQRTQARDLYISANKSQKEISEILGVSEQTLSKWAIEDKWKAARDAKLNTARERAEDIKEVISQLTARRLEVFGEIKQAREIEDNNLLLALKKEAASLSQEVASQTKALEKMDKEYRIGLAVYLEVMDDIFKSMAGYDQVLEKTTLDFQEFHLSTISMKLG